jgi:bZIP transcription factor
MGTGIWMRSDATVTQQHWLTSCNGIAGVGGALSSYALGPCPMHASKQMRFHLPLRQVQRRLRQNREAAQRSRQRKKAYMAALEAEVRMRSCCSKPVHCYHGPIVG